MKCISWLLFQALTTTCVVAQYVEPPWWPLIESTFDGEFDLFRCRKRTALNNGQRGMGPPSNGEKCARRPKTCFFGLQDCGTPYPDTKCVCNFRTWQCEPAICPTPSPPPPPSPPPVASPVRICGIDWDPATTTRISVEPSCTDGPETIPTEIGQLTLLEHLDYGAFSDFTGSIPTTIGLLTQLTFLNLSELSFTGSIPSTVGFLTDLEFLGLCCQGLVGSIPTAIAALTELTDLHLFGNFLTGSIPPQLGSLTQLESIDLSENALEGTIPTDIGLLTKLTLLSLSLNNLTGPVPTSALAELVNLRTTFWLNDNNLSGSIPSSLCSLDITSGARIDCGEIACNCCVGAHPSTTQCPP